MEYDMTLAAINPPSDVLTAINALKEQNMIMLEHDRIPAHGFLINYFMSEIERFDSLLKNLRFNKKTDYSVLNEAFRTIINDIWK